MHWLYDPENKVGRGEPLWPPYQHFLHEAPTAHNRRAIPAHDVAGLKTARAMAERSKPGIVYKYRDLTNKFHLSLLQDFSLWVPQFESLNDPFDGNIPLNFDYVSPQSRRALRAFNKNEIRQALEIVPHSPSSQLTAALRRTIRWMGGLSGHALWDAKFKHNRLGITRTYCGVSCFSTSCDNVLLWSHYANGHSGVCMGFDLHNLRFDFLRSTDPVIFGEIDYTDSSLDWPISEDEIDITTRYFLTKSSHWKYEQEYRILTPALCKVAIALSKESIKEITLGIKIAPADKQRVLDIVADRLPHVLVYQATFGNGISIEREQIN